MAEEETRLALTRDGFEDPYVRLAVSIIYMGIEDCRLNPLSQNLIDKQREQAIWKRDAIDFINGYYLEFLIVAADLNIDIKMLRKMLKPEIDKREEMNELLQKTTKGYPAVRKPRRKKVNIPL